MNGSTAERENMKYQQSTSPLFGLKDVKAKDQIESRSLAKRFDGKQVPIQFCWVQAFCWDEIFGVRYTFEYLATL